MTGWPTLIVEVAFTTVPSSLTPSWTDITAYVRQVEGLSWSHGLPDQYSTSQPGQVSLVLNNTDGRFTAGNTTSAYYPNVKLGKRLRVRETYNAVTYNRFDGYVNEWPTDWPAGGTLALASITCTDRFGKFGRARKLRSALQEEVLYDGPVAYWPLGEPAGAQSAADISGVQTNLSVAQVGAGGALTFAAGIGPPTDGLPAVVTAPFTITDGYYLRSLSIAGAVVGGVSTIECWFVCTSISPTSRYVMAAVFNDRKSHVAITVNSAGNIALVGNYYDNTDTVRQAARTGGVVLNNGLHHAVGVCTVSTTAITVTLYVDGALVGTTTTGSLTLTVPTSIVDVGVGALPPRDGSGALGLFTGTLAHAAVWGRAVTAAEAFKHYTAGVTGFAGEKADLRVARLARYTGVIDSSLLSLDAAASGIASQSFADGDVLGLMQEATEAEDGQLFMKGDGKLTLYARSRRYTTTSAFTLGAQTGVVDVTFTTDDQFMVNDATYSRVNGPAQRAKYTYATAGDYDIYADERTFALTTDNEVLDRANWAVNTRNTPAPRCSKVTVNMLAQTDNTLIAALLNADVSTRFTLNQLPPQAPASSVVLVVEGVSETVSGGEWSITFNTSPALTATGFILDTSLLGTGILTY